MVRVGEEIGKHEVAVIEAANRLIYIDNLRTMGYPNDTIEFLMDDNYDSIK